MRRSRDGSLVRSPLYRLLGLWFALGLAAATLLGGCGNKKKTTTPEDDKYLPQTAPANVLENLRTAYVERNIDAYAKLIHANFVFIFNPDDVNDPNNPTPPSWSRVEEVESARNMFIDQIVERIELSFSKGEAEAWTEIESSGEQIRVDSVNLTVATRNDQGEPLYLVVQGAVQRFYFLPDSTRMIHGQPTWEIRLWEDSPIGGKSDGDDTKVENTSWGTVKALYR